MVEGDSLKHLKVAWVSLSGSNAVHLFNVKSVFSKPYAPNKKIPILIGILINHLAYVLVCSPLF